jgi:predicted enzyme related to lactoylglutathione lyase
MMTPISVPAPQITRIILYVKNIPQVAAFYQEFFQMIPLPGATTSWLELQSPSGGCTIALHRASVAQKSGAAIKIVFGITDIATFKSSCEGKGLKFGAIHQVGTLRFANAKDPAGNSIQISNRGL